MSEEKILAQPSSRYEGFLSRGIFLYRTLIVQPLSCGFRWYNSIVVMVQPFQLYLSESSPRLLDQSFIGNTKVYKLVNCASVLRTTFNHSEVMAYKVSLWQVNLCFIWLLASLLQENPL